MRARTFRAARWLLEPDRWQVGGGLLVVDGRIERRLKDEAAVRRAASRSDAPTLDLGDGLVTPGLVDAHAHLDLGPLPGGTPAGGEAAGPPEFRGAGGFVPWLRAVIAARGAERPGEAAARAASSAARLVQGGTAAVGDVDATGASVAACAATALFVRAYREVFDAWDPARTAPALARVARALSKRSRAVEGLSPHAPYTTSRELLAGVARIALRRGAAIAVHWAETEAELRWLERGDGPLAELLGPGSPRASGLGLLEGAGLLGPRTSLVHGNHPARGEPERIAAAGASLVHCPGSHAYFGREPFPWRRYLRAGVRLALGTDSLASNADLDMRREMALARRAAPWLAPEAVWAMGTLAGARALGIDDRAGVLAPGRNADWVVFELAAPDRRGALDELTAGEPPVRSVWLAGRCSEPLGARGARVSRRTRATRP